MIFCASITTTPSTSWVFTYFTDDIKYLICSYFPQYYSILTGTVNGWFLVGPGNIASLGQSTYGLLLIAKLLLFAGMLGLAALNRYRLTPALAQAIEEEDAPRAQALLRASLVVEGGLAIVILGLVAWLGTLSPPMSM